MSKKFRVEHKNFDKPTITVTLNYPPYEDENILHKTGWKVQDVTITEIKQYREEE
jgi:hypothetical protein